jgi:hypothetical protein
MRAAGLAQIFDSKKLPEEKLHRRRRAVVYALKTLDFRARFI